MANINVELTDTFEDWRTKTNQISDIVGDLSQIDASFLNTDVVSIINEVRNTPQFVSPVKIVQGGVLSTDDSALEFTVAETVQCTVDSAGDVTSVRDLVAGRNVNGGNVVATSQLIGNSLTTTANATIGGAITGQTLTVTGGTSLNGNTIIGDATSDIVTINADINSTLKPEVDSSFDLGTTTLRWANLYVDNASVLGTVTTDALSVSSNVGIGGTLAVDGNTTIGNAASDSHVINGTTTHHSWIRPNADNTLTIGASNLRYNNIYAVTFTGTATAAQYADLAEKYLADAEYDVGTVMAIGGEAEVTAAVDEMRHSVLGVVSEFPAYLMNKDLDGGTCIALKGRVPVKIVGEVKKGDRLTASMIAGAAEANNGIGVFSFAIALEDSDGRGVIEAVIL